MSKRGGAVPGHGDKRALVRKRSRARRLAMQGLYQWQLTGQHVKDIMAQQRESDEYADVDPEHYRLLMTGVCERHEALDARLAEALDRPAEQLDPVEHAILWCALLEFDACPESPTAVVINEAVELAKRFGATDGHKFVNGVLDTLSAGRP